MIVQCKEEDVEKNGYRHTHTHTNMPHNDPAQYTVLGWVKKSSVYTQDETLELEG